MALSDKKILKERRKGRIVIRPFDRKRLSTSSYDVRLGENFYREQKPKLAGDVFNILDPAHVEKVWGKPQVASAARDVLPNKGKDFYGIKPKDQVILLEPGETILAHTEEFIGAKTLATTMMKARSSLGRSFILVCKCAGWGDVGYVNRWTMEVTNVSKHYSIPLLVGSRIAQIVFFKTGEVEAETYEGKGNYQDTSDVEKLMFSWHPASMLPKTRP